MKIITVPQDTAQHPDLVASSSMDVRMKLGLSRIQLNYRKIGHLSLPMLVVDCFNEKGKLYTLRYNLPVDRPERTERRIALLLHPLRQNLDVVGDAAA